MKYYLKVREQDYRTHSDVYWGGGSWNRVNGRRLRGNVTLLGLAYFYDTYEEAQNCGRDCVNHYDVHEISDKDLFKLRLST